MSTRATAGGVATEEQPEMMQEVESWQAGVAGGILGAIAFGALMVLVSPGVLTNAIPAMYGLTGGAAGTFIHLSHGAVIGVAFAALLRARPELAETLGRSTAAGAAYGVAVWVVLAVLVMPVWLSAVGFAGAPGLPNISTTSLVGHVIYGLVLGAAYPMLRRRGTMSDAE